MRIKAPIPVTIYVQNVYLLHLTHQETGSKYREAADPPEECSPKRRYGNFSSIFVFLMVLCRDTEAEE